MNNKCMYCNRPFVRGRTCRKNFNGSGECVATLVTGQVRSTSVTLKRALKLCLHMSGDDLCTRRAKHDGQHIDLEVGIGWSREPGDDCEKPE